ncbi:MAG: geranylgeranyl reductase family protein [Candidatus Nanopelagicales bacterium]
MSPASAPTETDVLIVGAGPAGSATAAWAARAGLDVLLVDAETFPRDKPCGDGLTPRAIAELDLLGLSPWLEGRARNWGLRAAGFGEELYLPWPGGSFPRYGAASPRLELDDAIRRVALDSGARAVEGHRAVDVRVEGGRVRGVMFTTGQRGGRAREIACRRLVVADGARSQLGRRLGRTWHRSTTYGVAARGYIASHRSDDPWISAHLELRGEDDKLHAGYGWVFPLGNGEVNVGVGTLASARHPADVNLRGLLAHYADSQRDTWQFEGDVRAPWSALLPMGGAVSGVAGPNWLLVGDAAGCINPLNGEGIDYGLETGHLAARLLAGTVPNPSLDYGRQWAPQLRHRYGAAFSIARRMAGMLTASTRLPTIGPVAMRSRTLMTVALRLMGNLVTPEDVDLTARLWRSAGRASIRLDDRPPFS